MRTPPRARRALVAIAAAAAAIFLLLMAASNVLLSGRLLRSELQTGPDDFFVNYDTAYSPWPGVVRVRGLTLRDRDGSTEWAFQAEEVRFRVSLAALAARHLSISSVSGQNLTFRARSRPEQGARPPDTKRLPPIPGMPAAPAPKPPAAPAGDPPGKPWSVRVDGIVLPVSEIWVNTVSWRGSAQLMGRFALEPGRRAEIGPTTVAFSDGVLRSEGIAVVAGTKGSVEGRIPSWEVERYEGDKIFEIVQGRVRLDGRLEGLEFLAGGFPGARLRGGKGSIGLELELAEGKGAGTIPFVARRAAATARGRTITGDLEGTLRMRDLDIPRLRASLSGSQLRLERASVEGSGSEEPWWARLTFPEARYSGRPPRVTARVEGILRNGRPIFTLAAGLPNWAAKGLSEREVRLHVGARIGSGSMDLREIRAIAEDLQLLGRYASRGEFERGVFLVDAGIVNVGFAVGGEKPGLKLFGPKAWYRKALAEWEAEEAASAATAKKKTR